MNVFEIPLQLINLQGDGFHLLVEVVVYGQAFNLVLDTGASKSALDKDTITALIDDDSQIYHLPDRHAIGVGTSSMERYAVIVPEFKIGDLIVENYAVPVFDLTTVKFAYETMQLPAVIGVLGGDILKGYHAVIDYQSNILRLFN
ncbi:aspartyl protease family protein [Pseudopedobacter beijingensis]|uniref:Aspartyl protease family protein n=1 Tax=Pseudopedobacter beijingensis TaxID=1207056 RepID=A0ABW4I8K0_9SPHI